MRFTYSDKHIEFLREHYPRLSVSDLASAFNAEFGLNKTPSEIKAACKFRGIRCGRPIGQLNRGRRMLLTQEQIEFVIANYPLMSRAVLTLSLNKTFGLSLEVSQIVAFIKNHGIKSGRTGRFVLGEVPFNAGTKGLMKPNCTSFKKGHMPHTYVPVGSTTIDTAGYHKTKVEDPNVWEFTHRHIYIKAHGPIPDSSAVAFIDGNRNNVTLKNLELIDRAELGTRNKFGVSLPPVELKQIAVKVVKLRMKTAALKREMRKQA